MFRRLVCVFVAALSTSVASAQVKLEQKFRPGERFETSIDSRLDQRLSFGGANIDASIEEHLLFESRVGERRDDGRLPIVERATAWQAEVTAAGIQTNFDLANAEQRSGTELDHFLDPQRQLAKMPRTILLDDAGHFAGLEGYENLREGVDAKSRRENSALLDAQYHRQHLAQLHDCLPRDELRDGDQWQRTSEYAFYANQSLQLTRKFVYAGKAPDSDRPLDRIEIVVTKAVYALDSRGEIAIFAAPTELSIVESTGELLFDRERGCIASCKEKLQLRGDMKLLIGAQGVELPSKVELMLNSSRLRLP